MQEYRSDAPLEEGEVVSLPEITFTLDGERFSCVREMDGDTLLEWSELGAAADRGMDANSPEGAAYLSRFLRASFGAAEYARFRRHCREHKTPTPVVLKVLAGIQEEMAQAVEAAAGRPTVQPSPSSPGDEARDERLRRVVSWGTGEVTVVPMPAPQDHKAKGAKQRKPAQRRAASAG